MGQATTGLAARRLCHMQEIAHEPFANEWQSLGQWTAEVEDAGGGGGNECKAAAAAWGATCCANDDGGCSVEEVLVVHHDALKKVNFLLRVDELSGCELPTVPECVVAAKRAEMQKKNSLVKENTSLTDEFMSHAPQKDFAVHALDAESDAEGQVEQSWLSPALERALEVRRASGQPQPALLRGMAPAPQPCMHPESDDEDPQPPSDAAEAVLTTEALREDCHAQNQPPVSRTGQG
mmetsp:Transcript_78051/g.220681  ORF Transcript_78051/g.220681 Transcript_78051/m.220681 type:complete len:236 (+) Transcript_78051:149-856(+)